MDTPLFKKYAVMNSGLLDASRYNQTIISSIGAIKVRHANLLLIVRDHAQDDQATHFLITVPISVKVTGHSAESSCTAVIFTMQTVL